MIGHLVLATILLLSLQTKVNAQESTEYENVGFSYDGHTHMLMVTKQAICYIFELNAGEQATVHSDAGILALEIKLIGQLTDPNLQLTTVPKLSLNTNILHQCGRNIAQYHIIKQ